MFLYLLVAIILPLIIAFLQLFNDTTKLVATILKWCFQPIPVFSTCIGIYNIILRQLLTMVFVGDGTLDVNPFETNDRFSGGRVANGLRSFDRLIAMWMLVFLLLSIPFYWMLLALIEGRVFSFCIRSIMSGRG